MGCVLDALTEEERARILKLCRRQRYREGEVIVKEGTPGEAFYIVESGRVLITKKTEEKEDKVLAILEEGDFFGEMSLLDRGPHSADARAMGDTGIIVIERRLFENMLKTDYRTATNLLLAISKILSERLRSSTEELVALYETGKIIGSSEDLQELISRTFKVLLDATGSSSGLFMLKNQFTGQMEIRDSRAVKGIEDKLVQSLLADSAGSLVNNLEQNEEIKGKIRAEVKIASFISSPLKTRERVIGFILLGKEFPGGYEKRNLSLLFAVSNQIATAVENAIFSEEVRARKKLGQVYIKF